MEQTTQQTIQKPAFPIKTKIAAWILILMGVSVASPVLYYTLFYDGSGCYGCVMLAILFLGLMLTIGSLFFLSGIFLLKRKRGAWWLSVIISLIALILSLIDFINTLEEIKNAISITGGKPWVEEPLFLIFVLEFVIIILFPFSFLLILIDRKNFWKIAT